MQSLLKQGFGVDLSWCWWSQMSTAPGLLGAVPGTTTPIKNLTINQSAQRGEGGNTTILNTCSTPGRNVMDFFRTFQHPFVSRKRTRCPAYVLGFWDFAWNKAGLCAHTYPLSPMVQTDLLVPTCARERLQATWSLIKRGTWPFQGKQISDDFTPENPDSTGADTTRVTRNAWVHSLGVLCAAQGKNGPTSTFFVLSPGYLVWLPLSVSTGELRVWGTAQSKHNPKWNGSPVCCTN